MLIHTVDLASYFKYDFAEARNFKNQIKYAFEHTYWDLYTFFNTDENSWNKTHDNEKENDLKRCFQFAYIPIQTRKWNTDAALH